MPIFEVQSKSGKIYEVDAPDIETAGASISEIDVAQESPDQSGAQPTQFTAMGNIAGGLGSGITNSLGFSVDAINSALGGVGLPVSDEPFLGSKSLGSALEAVGGSTSYDPNSFLGNAADVVGGSAPFAILGGTANFAKEMLMSLVPGAARGLVGMTGGSEDQKFAAEIVGGLGAARVVQSTRVASRMARKLYDPFSMRGAERQVAEGVQGIATDRDAAIKALNEPAPIDAQFMSGAKSKDFGLMALERQLVREGRTGEILAREKDLNDAIKRQIGEIAGDGATDDMIQFIRTDHERVLSTLDEAVEKAQREADMMARELPPIPGIQEQAASKMAAEKLDEVIKAARQDESTLWKQALTGPNDVKGAVDDITQRITAIRDSLGAGAADVPDSVLKALDKLNSRPTLEDIQSFRSRLLQEKRANNGQAAPDESLNRTLTLIDNVVLDALSESSSNKKMMDNARSFSRGLNDRFTRGPIAKVLGQDSRGGARVDPSLTLQSLLAKGPKGLVQVKALLDSAKDPSGVTQGMSAPELRQSVDDYMRAQFARNAFNRATGNIEPKAVDKFIENYAEILNEPEFADLKSFLKNAKSRTAVLDGLKEQRAITELDFNKSRASLFIGKEDPKALMERIMKSSEPNTAFDEVYDAVSKDQSGAAKAGLKRLYAESIVSSVEKNISDFSGDRVLSEAEFQKLLDSQERNIRKLYGKAGYEQVSKALDGLRMFMSPEKARVTKVGSDTVENIIKSPILDLLGGMVGTQAAGALPSAGAGSIQRAAIVSRVAKRIFGNIGKEKRREILVQAFEDPEKMKQLLQMELTPRNEGEIAETFNAWLGSVATETDDMVNDDGN